MSLKWRMPRFHLNLHNVHVDAPDDEGHDLPDLDAARRQAIEGIRDFIGHEARTGKIDFRGEMTITDEANNTVATIPFADAFTIHGI